jgi:CBS-domain-containing membrane protein
MTDTVTRPQAAQTAAKRWQSKAPAAPDLRTLLQSTVVALAGLFALVAVGKAVDLVLLAPPLAATAVIIAGAPASPPAQPRSVLAGHLLSAALGLLAVAALGVSPWTAAIAGGLSLTVMALVKAVHAPAAATAALIVAQHPPVVRTLELFVLGSVVLILIGALAAPLFRSPRYPAYWW